MGRDTELTPEFIEEQQKGGTIHASSVPCGEPIVNHKTRTSGSIELVNCPECQEINSDKEGE